MREPLADPDPGGQAVARPCMNFETFFDASKFRSDFTHEVRQCYAHENWSFGRQLERPSTQANSSAEGNLEST